MTDDETAQMTLVRCDEPFEMFRCKYVRHRFAAHMHETYSIGVIESGAARLRYRGADVTFVAGDVVAIEPQEVHTGEPLDAAGWSYRMLCLPAALMSDLGTSDASAPRFAMSRYPDAELAARIRSLHELLEREPDMLRQGSALAGLLRFLCDRHARPSTGTPPQVAASRLERVRAYMEANFARNITLRELAELCGVSSFHLIRLFRRAYGLPPYAYFDLIRLNRAKAMIQRGGELSDVACRSGFSDQSHMTRRFKRVFGVPPGTYARSYSRPLMPT